MGSNYSQFLANGVLQDHSLLLEAEKEGFSIVRLPQPSLNKRKKSWNNLVLKEKVLNGHVPSTKLCRIGKADSGSPRFGGFVANRLDNDKLMRDTFATIAKVLPGGYINGIYVVHYDSEYKKHKANRIDKNKLLS